MKNKQLIQNAAEYAQQIYTNCMSFAMDQDFASTKLGKLNERVKKYIYRYRRRPLKQFITLTYVASTVYNNEMLCRSDLFCKLNILCGIIRHKAYTPKKLVAHLDNCRYTLWCRLVPFHNEILTEIENKLLEDINVTNSRRY